mmetsp:Transcript_72590/g.144187  ORF Transcript_72590/g.144187 Transcript_72590/m.144187 type:complete len:240 (-) Transcript_72590:183-902(-)
MAGFLYGSGTPFLGSAASWARLRTGSTEESAGTTGTTTVGLGARAMGLEVGRLESSANAFLFVPAWRSAPPAGLAISFGSLGFGISLGSLGRSTGLRAGRALAWLDGLPLRPALPSSASSKSESSSAITTAFCNAEESPALTRRRPAGASAGAAAAAAFGNFGGSFGGKRGGGGCRAAASFSAMFFSNSSIRSSATLSAGSQVLSSLAQPSHLMRYCLSPLLVVRLRRMASTLNTSSPK